MACRNTAASLHCKRCGDISSASRKDVLAVSSILGGLPHLWLRVRYIVSDGRTCAAKIIRTLWQSSRLSRSNSSGPTALIGWWLTAVGPTSISLRGSLPAALRLAQSPWEDRQPCNQSRRQFNVSRVHVELELRVWTFPYAARATRGQLQLPMSPGVMRVSWSSYRAEFSTWSHSTLRRRPVLLCQIQRVAESRHEHHT